MNIDDLIAAFSQNEAGLFFLAGVDFSEDGYGGRVTVHFFNGNMKPEEVAFITDTCRLNAPDFELHFKEHETRSLRQARSLEALAKRFRHDRILGDPTGSFARLTALIDLVGRLRRIYPVDFDAILWKPQAAQLVLVPRNPGDGRFDSIKREIDTLALALDADALVGVIKSVELGTLQTAEHYTFVDDRSVPNRRLRVPVPRLRRLGLRLTAVAAMIGIGAMASAGTPPYRGGQPERDLPGVSALVDLTSLGESAFGTRNPYKAEGGLRLFFGDAIVLPQGIPEADDLSDFLGDTLSDPAGENADTDEEFAQVYGI